MIEKVAVTILLMLLLFFAGWGIGADRVQDQWDQERSRNQAIADESAKQDAAARLAVEEQHKKDIQNAESKAGRTAIARWLRDHGMLPDGTPLLGAGGGQAKGSQGADGTGLKCGSSGGIEDFALRCARDAIKVGSWQDWAKREGLEAE